MLEYIQNIPIIYSIALNKKKDMIAKLQRIGKTNENKWKHYNNFITLICNYDKKSIFYFAKKEISLFFICQEQKLIIIFFIRDSKLRLNVEHCKKFDLFLNAWTKEATTEKKWNE